MAASFIVNFDPAILGSPLVALGTGVPDGSNLGTNTKEAAAGRIGILVDSTDKYVAGTRQIITITFNAAKNASVDSAQVTFGSTLAPQSVSNVNGNLLTTKYETGKVTIGLKASDVKVSGRVLTPDGRGLRNATVSIIDDQGITRTTTTSSFGFYQFEDVGTGETHLVSVASKRNRSDTRVLQAFDNLADIDFVRQE